MRASFLSKIVYQTYNGYVLSQFKKIAQDVRARGAIKWKHPMHLIRLLFSGITILRDGSVPVRVEEHRERLLAIRRGRGPGKKSTRGGSRCIASSMTRSSTLHCRSAPTSSARTRS